LQPFAQLPHPSGAVCQKVLDYKDCWLSPTMTHAATKLTAQIKKPFQEGKGQGEVGEIPDIDGTCFNVTPMARKVTSDR